jgi:hypothetical protein
MAVQFLERILTRDFRDHRHRFRSRPAAAFARELSASDQAFGIVVVIAVT